MAYYLRLGNYSLDLRGMPLGGSAWPQGRVLFGAGVEFSGDGCHAQAFAANGFSPKLAHEVHHYALAFGVGRVLAVAFAPFTSARLLALGFPCLPQFDHQAVFLQLIEYSLDLEQRLAGRVGQERITHVLAGVGREKQNARVDAAFDEDGLNNHVTRQPVEGFDDDHGGGLDRRGGRGFSALYLLARLGLAHIQDHAFPLRPVGLGAGVGIPVNGGEGSAVFLGPRAAGGFLALEAVPVLGCLSLAGNPEVSDGDCAGRRFFGCSGPAHALIMHKLPTESHTSSKEFVFSKHWSELRIQSPSEVSIGWPC